MVRLLSTAIPLKLQPVQLTPDANKVVAKGFTEAADPTQRLVAGITFKVRNASQGIVFQPLYVYCTLKHVQALPMLAMNEGNLLSPKARQLHHIMRDWNDLRT